MNRLSPVSRSDLLAKLKLVGFEGPYPGGRHQYMVSLVVGGSIISPTQKGRHRSFYWTHDCNWGEHDNGPTYVCCTW